MDKRCTFKVGENWNCGSHAFNLYAEGIDQGTLCDRHYWQTKALALQEIIRKMRQNAHKAPPIA